MLCDLHKVGDPLEAPAHHHLDASLVQEDRLQVEQVPITEHTLPDLPNNNNKRSSSWVLVSTTGILR